jgi:hypothetical protein
LLKSLTYNGTIIRQVRSSAGADYIFSGRYADGAVSYSLLRPDAASGKNDINTLPARTFWFNAEQINLTDSIFKYSVLLSKINSLIHLEAPLNRGNFPYHMVLMNVSNHGIISRTGDTVYGNEVYDLCLIKDSLNPCTQSRYIYCFSIDVTGYVNQFFPLENHSNDRNIFGPESPDFILLTNTNINKDTISEPYGYDSYFMISTEDPIPDFSALMNNEAINEVASTRNVENEDIESPLTAMLSHMVHFGQHTRESYKPISSVPDTWSIEKITVLSRPPKN